MIDTNSQEFRQLILSLVIAQHWMKWFLENTKCNCEEGLHTCGKPARERDLKLITNSLNNFQS